MAKKAAKKEAPAAKAKKTAKPASKPAVKASAKPAPKAAAKAPAKKEAKPAPAAKPVAKKASAPPAPPPPAKVAKPAKPEAKIEKPAKEEKKAKAPIVEEEAVAPKKEKKAKIDKTGMSEDQLRWAELHEKYKSVKANAYSIGGQFEAKTPISHKIFGWGFILSNEYDRLEVLFEDGKRMLISNRKLS
ncbi:hypothetical protein [Bdellovibrio sp. HCB2-146]|uniref:hypothetical protein n=1 Tax=Bdellovibrio sp. HCB2-146 TaxID=3394362 RepID=UPI0039BD0300